MDFVHLHAHSHYSFEEGVASPDALVRRARDLGMRALALTDNTTLAGVVPFCKACQKYSVRPIIGAEFSILPHEARIFTGEVFKIVLLVETEQGYRNLVRLIQRAHTAAMHGRPMIRLDDMQGQVAGLVALEGGVETELFHLMTSGRKNEGTVHVERLASIFGRENVVLEVQSFGEMRQGHAAADITRLADMMRLLSVATNDAAYVKPEDSICQEFLKAESPPTFYNFGERRDPVRWRHLASASDMMRKFTANPQVIRNTVDLAERCAFQPNFGRKRYPSHDFVRGFDADSYLWDLTFKEARGRFSELTTEMKERLNEEFDYIRSEGLSNNILLLWDATQFCRRSRITLGVGRGNMISSLVAYILGITQINPLDHKLRFLGFSEGDDEGHTLALEIPTNYAPDLHEFLREQFGENFCAAVGRYQPATKTQLAREICSWFRMPYAEAAAGVEAFDEKQPASETSLERLFLGRVDGVSLPNVDMIKFMLARLLPRPRMLAAADQQFAISGENLTGLVPRVDLDGEAVAQFDADSFDAFNIPRLKIETTTLLNIIDTAARWVRHQENSNFDPDRIPMDDEDTYALLCRGDTTGIDPFHSITMKSLLREHRPRNFMQLVKMKSMERRADGKADSDVRDHVPECILTFRCAFIRSHYPLSFTTALLTHTHRNRKKFTVVLREAKKKGVRILPPDINRSLYEFSIVPKAIRTGLMVVSGMGMKAYGEIERVRKGGDFADLMDFVRRTDARLINHRLLNNLARAGAFDEFGLKRSQLLAVLEDHAGMARRESAAPSLFDGTDEYGGPPPIEPPDIPEFSESEIIRNEIAAAGYCISFDQLHYYRDIISRCRAMPPYDLSSRMVGNEVHLAGFVEVSDAKSTLAEDDTVLVDMEGRVVTMAAKTGRLYHAALEANAPVLVSGQVHRRKDEVFVRAKTAFTLRMVHMMSKQVLGVEISLAGENLRTVRLIRKLLGKFKGGDTVIRALNIPSAGIAKWYASGIDGSRVFFCPPLYYGLKTILPESSLSLEVTEDMPQELLHALSPSRFPAPEGHSLRPEPEENSAILDAY